MKTVEKLHRTLGQITAETRPCTCQWGDDAQSLRNLGWVAFTDDPNGHAPITVTPKGHARLEGEGL